MAVQLAIPVSEEIPPIERVCAWCGEPAIGDVMVAPVDLNKATKETRRREIRADVCEAHRDMVNHENERAHLEGEIKVVRKRLAKLTAPSRKYSIAANQLSVLEDKLQGLLELG